MWCSTSEVETGEKSPEIVAVAEGWLSGARADLIASALGLDTPAEYDYGGSPELLGAHESGSPRSAVG